MIQSFKKCLYVQAYIYREIYFDIEQAASIVSSGVWIQGVRKEKTVYF